MSITSITENWSGDEAEINSPDAKNFTLTAHRTLVVLVDDPANWVALGIMAALIDPQIRNSYPIDFYLRCNNLKIKRVSPNRYELTADYETHSNLIQSPLDLPPDIEYDQVFTQEQIGLDNTGKVLATINGELPDPPVTSEIPTKVVRITRNMGTFDDSVSDTYTDAVNSDTWFGRPPGTVKCAYLKAHSVTDQDFEYFSVSAEFHCRRAAPGSTDLKAWYYRQAAMGMLVKRGGKIVLGLDDAGQPTTVPVAHDTTTGAQLASGAAIQFYEWPVKRIQPFNSIGII